MTAQTKSRRTPTASMALVPAEEDQPQLVYDEQRRPVGWQIGDRLVPLSPHASVLPSPPAPEAFDHLLHQGREALHALQLARADGQVAIDLDYADQILGGPRSSWNKFQQNRAHNRSRSDVLGQTRAGIELTLAAANQAMQFMFATYAAEQQAGMEERLQQRRIAMQVAAWQAEEQAGPDAQAHRRTVELTRLGQEHEVTLAVLQAGQQLPDLLAQLQRQAAADPTQVASSLMTALQLAITQYQQLVSTTDPAARKQLAEQFRPMLLLVLQQAIAAAKTGVDGGKP